MSNKQLDLEGNFAIPDKLVLIDRDIGEPLPTVFRRSDKSQSKGHPSGNPFLNRLLVILDKYRGLGEVVFPNGTLSIGKIPDKEQWFLCHIYGGLTSKQIVELANWTKTGFPEHVKRFYSVCNGMRLFGASQFAVCGYRGSAPEGMPNYQPIPFFTAHPDACREMPNAPHDAIFIGGCFGGYHFYTTFSSATVYACKSPDATPIAQWPTIEDMILDVAERLSKWFDENAQPIDSAVNERPVLFEPVRHQESDRYDKPVTLETKVFVDDQKSDRYEDKKEDIPKSATAIARRALVLSAVITTAYGSPSEQVMKWLKQESLEDELTPEERKFLNGQLAERNRINFTWKVEALTPLLWSINKLKTFPSLTDQIDTNLLKEAVIFPPNDTKDFINTATLRGSDEISHVYEHVYNAHWKVRDAQINGKEIPDFLIPGVVMERHYGFNWLIGYCGQEWDEITTDT